MAGGGVQPSRLDKYDVVEDDEGDDGQDASSGEGMENLRKYCHPDIILGIAEAFHRDNFANM